MVCLRILLQSDTERALHFSTAMRNHASDGLQNKPSIQAFLRHARRKGGPSLQLSSRERKEAKFDTDCLQFLSGIWTTWAITFGTTPLFGLLWRGLCSEETWSIARGLLGLISDLSSGRAPGLISSILGSTWGGTCIGQRMQRDNFVSARCLVTLVRFKASCGRQDQLRLAVSETVLDVKLNPRRVIERLRALVALSYHCMAHTDAQANLPLEDTRSGAWWEAWISVCCRRPS
ncbi:hypothetical protein D9756_004469 [Leucocoprinus leucothites]|uniref:Uncharacterized protein n=1 Tax=Leucocoprinus leucothites TaxID=201217 RepID=A0A8H5G9U8_9AGAR|nr:hypothetical protein D9756_004469 [Leucoagaricus leucothites]